MEVVVVRAKEMTTLRHNRVGELYATATMRVATASPGQALDCPFWEDGAWTFGSAFDPPAL